MMNRLAPPELHMGDTVAPFLTAGYGPVHPVSHYPAPFDMPDQLGNPPSTCLTS